MIKILSALVLFLLTVFALLNAGAAPHPLEKEKESRILFMLFENQNRRTIGDAADCKAKATPRPWSCDHGTVKSVLMEAMYLGLSQNGLATQNKMECEPVTKEIRDQVLSEAGAKWGPKDFRREVVQALDGQWVCSFVSMKTPPANADASAVLGPNSTFGLTFLLNRDQSRIVSRDIVAWSQN